jgi:hypothetical protein
VLFLPSLPLDSPALLRAMPAKRHNPAIAKVARAASGVQGYTALTALLVTEYWK